MSVTAKDFVGETSMKYQDFVDLFTDRPGSVQIGPEKFCLPSPYQMFAKDIKEFCFKEDDTIVMTMPKSGTTWTLEVVWTLKNNADFENFSALLAPNMRCPNLEMDILIETEEKRRTFFENVARRHPDLFQLKDTFLEALQQYPGPRIFKTHLSFQLLSDTALSKAKVVYVVRDPRDVCISFFHHCKIFKFSYFAGSFHQFVDAFMEGATPYGPYWSHVGAAWERRHHPNLHVVFYEHMKKRPKAELQKLSEFLGLQISESQMEKIVDYTSFDAMKKRGQHFVDPDDASTFMNLHIVREQGGFYRQGTYGGWKDVLTEDQKWKFETWIKKNCPDDEILDNFVNS